NAGQSPREGGQPERPAAPHGQGPRREDRRDDRRPQAGKPGHDRPQGERSRSDRPWEKRLPRDASRHDRSWKEHARQEKPKSAGPDPDSPFAKLLALKAKLEEKP
ncbi:MAG TPA: hypothetical protein PK812_03295, partial [Beijerinckiaceae bacterium]|nr:hypothetical protein [Beijerinckiaceae bacterium]